MSIHCGVCGSRLARFESQCINCERVEEIRAIIKNLPTVRDVFAAHALGALLTTTEGGDFEGLGDEAFDLADQMMEARNHYEKPANDKQN
jgi:hypothetical protein